VEVEEPLSFLNKSITVFLPCLFAGKGLFFPPEDGLFRILHRRYYKVTNKKSLEAMKAIEIMKISKKVLELLQECCIRIDDVRYVGIYDEFSRIVESGAKVTYAVAFLSEKYGISERKVYYLLRKFSRDCKVDAEG